MKNILTLSSKDYYPLWKQRCIQITTMQLNYKCLKKKVKMSMGVPERKYYLCLKELVYSFASVLGFEQRTGFQ